MLNGEIVVAGISTVVAQPDLTEIGAVPRGRREILVAQRVRQNLIQVRRSDQFHAPVSRIGNAD